MWLILAYFLIVNRFLEHPRVEIVTVQEAYELGRKLARHLSAVGQATN